MRYRCIIFVVYLLSSAAVSAQTTETRFSVCTANNVPLAGIEVIRNNAIVARTDNNGRVSLPDVKKGERILFRETCVYRYGYDGNYTRNPETHSAWFTAPEDNPPGIRMITATRNSCDERPQPEVEHLSPSPVNYPQVADSIYTVVDEMAEFPGGRMALNQFLAEHMRYPEIAREFGITGKVYLQFVVEKDGSLTSVTVKHGIPDCPECDREAKRLVKLMPKWKPAKRNGQIVRSQFNLPVRFDIE